VLKIAFASKGGNKVKKLYNGDIFEYNDDHSSADMALCSHLAFYSGRPDQVERLWLSSPLGNRKKTQERLDYRIMTISKAFQGKTEFFTPKSKVAKPKMKSGEKGKELELIGRETKNGKIIKPILENIIRVISRDNSIMSKLKYNDWTKRIEWKDRWLEDRDIIAIQSLFQSKYPDLSDVTKNTIADAVQSCAMQNIYNPVTDWLNSLKWDGKSRLEEWVDTVCGYPEDDSESFMEYRSAVGVATIKAMVARALNPGTKYDHMLVIEGEQGTGKSTLVNILAGNDLLYSTNVKDIRDKDFKINTQGMWVVELSEGSTLSMSSVQDIKHMITETISIFRPAYGKLSESHPRQFVLMMTTNEGAYLRDRTGNRRFLPLKVYLDFIDIDWLRNNRNQIFAEAVHLWKTDTSFNIPVQESKIQQELRMEIDPIEEMITDYMDNLSEKYIEENGIDPREVWASKNQYKDPSIWDIKCIYKSLSNR
jgi:predicted P-loop ATPase